MCGILGIWQHKSTLEELSPQLVKAAETLSHRGPDSHGCWYDETTGLALGHRRLAIVDLSPQGAQPMVSLSQRFVVVMNGEIYNHLSLRNDLSSIPWKSRSDTETLLAACEAWGLEKTLEKVCGMFAFALFDRKEQTLTLARDPMGEKPLYYGRKEGAFVFASELKPFLTLAKTPFNLNKQGIVDYFRYGYIPAPCSIFEGIFKLPPGHTLTLSLKNARGDFLPKPQAYYTLPPVSPSPLPPQTNQEKLDILLRQVIQEQMLTDVPLGAFLSGGIDSSLVVALMQALSPTPVKTFCIGFHKSSFNEAPYAKAVAAHLQTDHTELYVSEKQAWEVIPHLPLIYDEPFADSSQIPTFLVSRLAREKVTVSLSGDGGDELFGGYNRYRLGEKAYRSLSFLPLMIRKSFAEGLSLLPAPFLNSLGESFPGMPPELGNKVHRLAQTLTKSPEDFFMSLLTCWPKNLTTFETLSPSLPSLEPFASKEGFVNAMMRADLGFYLPNDVLTKVDRAAMANGLETRAPFLDVRIVDFAQKLPFQEKIFKGETKRILRNLLYTYVPASLVERPKQGFSIPLDSWLREGLKDWAAALLETLSDHPFLNAPLIQSLWEKHQKRTLNAAQALWVVLMYLSWYQTYKSHLSLH